MFWCCGGRKQTAVTGRWCVWVWMSSEVNLQKNKKQFYCACVIVHACFLGVFLQAMNCAVSSVVMHLVFPFWFLYFISIHLLKTLFLFLECQKLHFFECSFCLCFLRSFSFLTSFLLVFLLVFFFFFFSYLGFSHSFVRLSFVYDFSQSVLPVRSLCEKNRRHRHRF